MSPSPKSISTRIGFAFQDTGQTGRIVTLPNGTVRRQFQDGRACVQFNNGDCKRSFPDGVCWTTSPAPAQNYTKLIFTTHKHTCQDSSAVVGGEESACEKTVSGMHNSVLACVALRCLRCSVIPCILLPLSQYTYTRILHASTCPQLSRNVKLLFST